MMADKLKFDLVSPEKLLLSGAVDMVRVPGTEGDFGVLVHHSPMMAVLRPGVVEVDDGDKQTRYFVRGGFADVTPEGLTLLADNALMLDGLKAADIDAEIKAVKDESASDTDSASDSARKVIEALEDIRSGL